MKRYSFNLRSESGMILLFLLIIGTILIEIYFLRELISGSLLFAILAGTTLLGTYFSRKLTLAKTLWTLTEEEFTITWLTQFKFQKNADIIIKWTDVKSYKDIYGDGYSIFVIKLIDGKVLRFPYGALFKKDDSSKLKETFHVMYLNAVHPEQIPLGYSLKKDFGMR